MEKVELSEKARQQIAGLQATNKRLLADGLEFEALTHELEALAKRKENILRRYQAFLAEIQSEHQAIEAEFQRIRRTSLAH